MDDIYLDIPDGQVMSSDSYGKEEEEEEEEKKVLKSVSFAREDNILPTNPTIEKIDFTEFDILSEKEDFPINVIDLFDKYLQQYQDITNNNGRISSDDLELFNQKLLLSANRSDLFTKLLRKDEKTKLSLEFILRHATLHMISFLSTNNISYANLFLTELKKFDDYMNNTNPIFFSLQKRYCILLSTYFITVKFDSFESVAHAITWCSFEENHSFHNELFAPYVCLADGIKSFSHRLYKQAALRSFTAFDLFREKDIELKKKCLVIYYISSLFLTNDIKIYPNSFQKYLMESFFLITKKNITEERSKIDSNQGKNTSNSNNGQNSSLKGVLNDNGKNMDKNYIDDKNLRLILDFVKYHQKCDYESASSKFKDVFQEIGKTYKFVFSAPINKIPNVIKKRAISQFLSPFRSIKIDFICGKFSFKSYEETKNFLIDMIREKEINHFLNDLTGTLEIVDEINFDTYRNTKQEYSPTIFLKKANELLNSLIDSFI